MAERKVEEKFCPLLTALNHFFMIVIHGLMGM